MPPTSTTAPPSRLRRSISKRCARIWVRCAFPLAFRPVLLAPYSTHCEPLPAWTANAGDHAAPALVRRTAQAFAAYRDPARQPYLHLVDGGVLDNLGLTSLSLMRETAGNAYGPLTARDAVRVRRL